MAVYWARMDARVGKTYPLLPRAEPTLCSEFLQLQLLQGMGSYRRKHVVSPQIPNVRPNCSAPPGIMAKDPFNLQRFVDAQSGVFAQVLAELGQGRKIGHWMWFIFPQLDGLGSSSTARFYALKSLDEARAYLARPQLGQWGTPTDEYSRRR